MEVIHESVAGLDVHKETVVACVRVCDAGRVKRECRTFGTTTEQLLALLAWLQAFGCSQVAMEATGVYWMPIWKVLSDGDFTLVVANAAHVNDVFGTTGRTAGVYDRDYFTFTVPVGYTLASVIVLRSVLSAGGGAFLGFEAGGQVTVDPDAPSAAPLLGYLIVSPASTGTDILPAIAVAAGAIGFAPPLDAGQYSTWVQDGHPSPSLYRLRFGVVPVPEPDSALLILTGLGVLVRIRRLSKQVG